MFYFEYCVERERENISGTVIMEKITDRNMDFNKYSLIGRGRGNINTT